MSTNKVKKSITQRIKDALASGKSLTEAQVTSWGASERFLGKRVSEFRAQGLNIALVNKRGVSSYKLQNV